jgi:hypothetical protein
LDFGWPVDPGDRITVSLPETDLLRHTDHVYEELVRRYTELLNGPHLWLTDAMSWTVVTGSAGVESIIERLGGDPSTVVQQRPVDDDYDYQPAQSRWYLDTTGNAVGLLEVNNFQASRPEVLRRLTGAHWEAHSAYWNIESDNSFSYASLGEVVTQFDGGYPVQRSGSAPDALEGQQEPLWAVAGESWRAAMLALMELRTGVRLDASWFEQPHLTLLTPEIPDDPPVRTPDGEIVDLLQQKENPRRHAALAWLTRTLADRFDLNDPALARAIDARQANVRVDDATERQVRDMTRNLVRQMLARDTTLPQELDPVWRRGQAAMAAVKVLDFFDPSILILHAKNALADDWALTAPQLRARL